MTFFLYIAKAMVKTIINKWVMELLILKSTMLNILRIVLIDKLYHSTVFVQMHMAENTGTFCSSNEL